MDLTPANIRAVERGFSTVFRTGYDQTNPFYQQVAYTVPSVSSENVYGWMADLPNMREWLGERQFHNLEAHEYTLKNKTWELSAYVKRETIEDDSFGVYNPAIQNMGMRAKKHPDQLIATLMNNGENIECYDGANFFSASHPTDPNDPGSATQQNYWSSGKGLDETNLIAVRAAMMNFKNEKGERLNVRPNLIVVPSALEITARKILQATLTTNGGTNVLTGLMDILVVPELDSDTEWYLLDTTNAIKPFIYQERRALQYSFSNQINDESVRKLKRFEYYADCRDNAGVSLWFLATKASS